MNIGAPWPTLVEAEARVLRMQTKLHQWAVSDPDRRFDDLFNLVYDPAVLVVAWRRVRGNKGKRSGGVDGVAPVDVADVAELLSDLREDMKAGRFVPLPARERMIPKTGGKLRRLGIATVRDRTAQAALKLVPEPIFEADCAPRGAALAGEVKDLPGFLSQQGPEAGGSPSLEVQVRVGAASTT